MNEHSNETSAPLVQANSNQTQAVGKVKEVEVKVKGEIEITPHCIQNMDTLIAPETEPFQLFPREIWKDIIVRLAPRDRENVLKVHSQLRHLGQSEIFLPDHEKSTSSFETCFGDDDNSERLLAPSGSKTRIVDDDDKATYFVFDQDELRERSLANLNGAKSSGGVAAKDLQHGDGDVGVILSIVLDEGSAQEIFYEEEEEIPFNRSEVDTDCGFISGWSDYFAVAFDVIKLIYSICSLFVVLYAVAYLVRQCYRPLAKKWRKHYGNDDIFLFWGTMIMVIAIVVKRLRTHGLSGF